MAILVLLHMNDETSRVLAVGASGGVMGLIGATAGVMLLGWLRERAHFAKRRLINMAVIVLMQSAFDFAIPEISFTVHISGALIGFASVLVLGRRRYQPLPTR